MGCSLYISLPEADLIQVLLFIECAQSAESGFEYAHMAAVSLMTSS